MTYEQALSRAAALCSRSEHCESQVREKLRQWDLSEDESDRIIEYLYNEKYLDNERFARAFVSDKFRYNQWGRMKIRQALRFLRLPDDAIGQALQEIDDEEYASALRKIIDAKARSLRDDDPRQRQAKLVRHALSRGFEMDLVLRLVEE